MRGRRRLLVALIGLAACFDSGGPPRPGTLGATVESPNGEEGAAVVELLGYDVLAVHGTGSTEAYSATYDETVRVVLIHPEGGTLTFEVEVTDTRNPPVVLFREVAGTDDGLRGDVSGYRVAWSQ